MDRSVARHDLAGHTPHPDLNRQCKRCRLMPARLPILSIRTRNPKIRSSIMRCLHLGTLLMAMSAGTAAAADWPQWLGPNRDGSTTETIVAWKGDLKPVW